MKFDINTSKYAMMWESREGRQIFSKFIQDPNIIKQNHLFWKKNFAVDPLLSERDPKGRASFTMDVKSRNLAYMLDMRAPLSETEVRDKQGMDFYTGTIPDFAAKGYVEQAMEREARARMFEDYFGNDAQILAAYADDIQAMVDEANQTMSNLAAQALSTGMIRYNFGTGIKGNLYKSPIPAANFVKAGAKIWADPECLLITQMRDIEEAYRTRTGSTIPLKWQITRDMFYNVVLKNKQVIEYIADFRKVNDKPYAPSYGVDEAMFNEAFSNNPMISPIEIVQEGQSDMGTAVHGWATGVAVLRPAGYAGLVKRANILDVEMSKKYGSSVISQIFAHSDIYTLVNTTLNNGKYKEWHTDLLVAAVPVLSECFDHIIVDTTTANA